MKSDQSCKRDLVIGIDTSDTHLGVTILQNEKLVIQGEEPKKKGNHRLFPLIHEMFREKKLSWDRMKAIGVCVGPGNFNGIRVGVSAARGLSLSLGIPAIGVDKFTAVALGYEDPLLIMVKSVKDNFFARLGTSGQPFVTTLNTLKLPATENLSVIGFDAEKIGAQFGLKYLAPKYNPSHSVAIISSSQSDQNHPPPKPFYVSSPRIDPNVSKLINIS